MKAFKLMFAVTVLMLSNSCAIYHYYPPYSGKIIDADTAKPLEGAVVLVAYGTVMSSPGGAVGYFLDSREAVSDKAGEFKIPSLHAITFRPLSAFKTTPEIWIFKPKFRCYSGYAEAESTIELKELKDKEARIENTHCQPSHLVPFDKMKEFHANINKELVDLGLEPY